MLIYLENYWFKIIFFEVLFFIIVLLFVFVILLKCIGEKWYNLERIGLRLVFFLIGYK